VPEDRSGQPAKRILNGLTRVGDVRLLITDDGELDAPSTFVLVHGWGSSSTTWSTQLEGLCRLGRVIGLDLRGHGGSEPGDPNSANVPQLAADIARVIELAGARNVVLIGHSMGGNVASMVAIEHPGLVEALVVIDPAYGADDDEMLTVPSRVEKHLNWGAFSPGEDVGGFSPAAPLAMRSDARHNLLEVSGHTLASLVHSIYLGPGSFGHEDAARAYLATRTQPALALYPTERRASTERSLVSDSATILIAPVASHFLHQEAPDWFVDAVRDWHLARRPR
jgi:pimeloyl-ACP methyl ester carboxylesterase